MYSSAKPSLEAHEEDMIDREKETTDTPGQRCRTGSFDTPRRLRRQYQHLKDMGYSVIVSRDRKTAIVDIPGPSYDAFDRHGNCKIWSLMRLMATSRYFAYHYSINGDGDTFMDFGKMTNGIYTFMASSMFVVEKTMYNTDVPKWPLIVKAQLGYIGNCSTNIISNLYVPSTGDLLVHNINQVVAIDQETRKSTPLPLWWKEKFGHLTVRNEPYIFPRFTIPDNASLTMRRVTYSETDMYNHANWTSYVIYSVDAMHHGIRNGMFKKIDESTFKCGLKKIQMSYLGECVEGDLLEVYFWEDDIHSRTIHVVIKKNNVTTFQSSLEYHDD